MKRLIQLAAFLLVLAALMPTAGATETKCTRNATRATPPVPNYPTHIRNVVWRNMRAQCQSQTATIDSSKASSRPTKATTSSAQTQSQKQ